MEGRSEGKGKGKGFIILMQSLVAVKEYEVDVCGRTYVQVINCRTRYVSSLLECTFDIFTVPASSCD